VAEAASTMVWETGKQGESNMLNRSGLSLLAFSALAASTAAAQDFDWRKHEGTTIHGVVLNNPGINAFIKPLMGQFEEETGITVRLEQMVDTQMRKKQDIVLAGKDSSMDFFTLQMDNRGVALTAAGLLENLEPYLNDPELTPADYNYPDDWAGG
jgi:multiple sugar transport system substrate-binding protein